MKPKFVIILIILFLTSCTAFRGAGVDVNTNIKTEKALSVDSTSQKVSGELVINQNTQEADRSHFSQLDEIEIWEEETTEETRPDGTTIKTTKKRGSRNKALTEVAQEHETTQEDSTSNKYEMEDMCKAITESQNSAEKTKVKEHKYTDYIFILLLLCVSVIVIIYILGRRK